MKNSFDLVTPASAQDLDNIMNAIGSGYVGAGAPIDLLAQDPNNPQNQAGGTGDYQADREAVESFYGETGAFPNGFLLGTRIELLSGSPKQGARSAGFLSKADALSFATTGTDPSAD